VRNLFLATWVLFSAVPTLGQTQTLILVPAGFRGERVTFSALDISHAQIEKLLDIASITRSTEEELSRIREDLRKGGSLDRGLSEWVKVAPENSQHRVVIQFKSEEGRKYALLLGGPETPYDVPLRELIQQDVLTETEHSAHGIESWTDAWKG